jgi:hypothetical protein
MRVRQCKGETNRMKSPSRTSEIGSERGSTNPSSSSSRAEASLRSSSSRSHMPYLHTCRDVRRHPNHAVSSTTGVTKKGPEVRVCKETHQQRATSRHRCHKRTTSKFQLKTKRHKFEQIRPKRLTYSKSAIVLVHMKPHVVHSLQPNVPAHSPRQPTHTHKAVI